MLDDFLLFVEVARRGSYAQTAHDLSITSPTLSKRISALEKCLGESLFIRSSRGVNLTSYGADLYNNYGHMARDLNAKLSDSQQRIPSYFTVYCPQNIMEGQLYPALETFMQRQELTDTHVTIAPSNTNILLSQATFDLAIRIGEQRDSAFYQKRIGSIAVCAVRTTHCKRNDCLITPYANMSSAQFNEEQLGLGIQKRMAVHDITIARKLVASGLGVGILPCTEIRELSKDVNGKFDYLSEVLFTRSVYALWANSPKPSKLAQLLIDELEARVARVPELQGKKI